MAEIDSLIAPSTSPAPDMGSARLADDASMQQFDALQQEQKRQQDRDLARKSLDQNQIYTLYPDLASADQKAKGTSDAASVMLNLSYRLNKPLDEVRQNFQMLRTGYAQAQGWDVASSDSVFKTKFQEQFQKEDDQQKAIQNLQSKALQDSVTYAGKGMSRNPLAAFSEWNKEHGAILGDATEAQKLKIFNETYLPVQKQMSSPIGMKAAQLVDALTKNSDAAGIPEAGADKTVAAMEQGQDAPAQPEKIDPVQLLKGMSGEEQDKVLGLAAQLMATKQPEMGNGMKAVGGLGQAFAQGFLSYNAINQIDDLVDAEKRLKAAQTPEDAQKAKDDIENIKLTQKIKQAEQMGNTVQPELYGLPKFAYEAAQGVASMPGAVAPAVIPVLGEFAFYKLAQAQDAMKLMAQNPGMTAEEAKSKVTIASAAYGITMGRLAAIFGEASPGLGGFLKHTLQGTLVMEGAEAERILGRQLQSEIEPSFNPNEDYGTEWLDLLKSTPQNFVTLAAFGGMVKLIQGERPVDPNSAAELEKQAGNSRLLQYLGFTQETAERVAGLKEGQRLKALADEWGNRTPEQKQAGVELAREDAAKAEQTLASPDAPKIEQTPDGKYAVTTKDGDQTHTVVFSTEEGARQALEMELQFHEEKNASTEPTNDWTSATEEGGQVIDKSSQAMPEEKNSGVSPKEIYTFGDATGADPELDERVSEISKTLAKEPFYNGKDPGLKVVTPDGSSPSSRGASRFLQTFQDLVGKRVVWVASKDGGQLDAGAFIDKSKPNTIYLSAHSDTPIHALVGEEWLHSVEKQDPDAYKDLIAKLKPHILDWKGNVGKMADLGYRPEMHEEEFVGKLVADAFTRPDFWRIVEAKDKPLFQKIVDSVNKWFEELKGKLVKTHWATEETISNLEAVHKAIADTLQGAAEKQYGELDFGEYPNIAKSLNKFRDEAYDKAVKSGDEAEQQRLVDEAAKEAGYTIKAHHGTAREDRVGTRFRKSRATSGPMAYFTNDREIAEKYANGKKDTSLPMPDDYRDWFKIQIPGSKKEANIRDAWNYLSPEKKEEITKNYYTTGYSDRDAYEGPIIRNSGGSIAGKDTLDYNLREARGNTLEAAKELWLNSGQLFNRESEFLDVLKALGVENARLDDPNATKPKVYDTYLKIQKPLVTTEIPDEVMSALRDASKQQRKPKTTYGADAWDKRTRDPKDWMSQLDSDYAKGENSMVWTSIPDWVTKTLERFGYDGIHDTGGKMGGKGHDVYIPFEEHQVKSSEPVTTYDSGKPIPLSERFNENRNDIRFSKEKRPEPIIGDIPPPKTIKEQAAEIAARVASTVRDLPKDSAFKRHLLQWSARSQASSNEVMRVQHTIETTIKDKAKRDGITNWIEAGGDRALLLQRAAASKDPKIRAGYEAAAKFTPEEIKVAEKVRDTFNILEARAKKWGIDMGHRENYVPHVYTQEPQPPSGSSPKRLSEFFKFSQERTFESYFGGEQAGYHPQTKDISKLLGLYLNDMNNAINSRRFVAELSKGKASDGRPLVSPRGSGTAKKGEHGESEVHLVYPDAAQEGHEDYKVIDQPALHDWSFAGKDENGKNIMVKGDLAVHPEIADHFSNALGSSAIRRWWNTKTENPFLNFTKGTAKFLLDDFQSLVKGTMLSFSPFHQVQEGIHAIGHRVNPFANIPKIDLRDPKQADAAAHGLMLSHDRLSQSLFMEGVGTNNRNLVTMGLRKIGWGLTTAAADKVDAYQHWLFSQYIPGLKLKTYEHILERNMERFKADIAAGKATEFQVKNLSAHQANAAYGHLNYTEMGHNPTIRHAFQIVLLAPDFLEARSRFVAQSLKSLTGTKTGIEQLQAFAFLAITQVVAATIQKVLTNGDPEWDHPFEMRFGNKYFGMRSVPEDVFKMLHNPTGFIGGRISPIFGRFIQEGVFGVNYRGERTSVGDAIADIMAGIVPMPMQSLTRQWTTGGAANPISPLEQILSSAGVQVHRYSPITKVYPLAHDWVKKNYPEDVQRGSYPVSKYQQLRYALEDNDLEAAKKEVDRLVEGGMKRADIGKAFKASVNHPFTGSKDHDKEFYKSLDEDEKQRYDAAIERRKEILRRFMSVPY